MAVKDLNSDANKAETKISDEKTNLGPIESIMERSAPKLYPFTTDIDKICCEINDLMDRRFAISTVALTLVLAYLSWIIPQSYESQFAFRTLMYSGLLLSIIIFSLYMLSRSLHTSVRMFSVYLQVTGASNWESHFKAFRQKNGNRSGIVDNIAYMFFGLIIVSGSLPFLIYLLNQNKVSYDFPYGQMFFVLTTSVVLAFLTRHLELNHIERIEEAIELKWAKAMKLMTLPDIYEARHNTNNQTTKPTDSDIDKINNEIARLMERRFTLTTTAITIFSIFVTLVMPKHITSLADMVNLMLLSIVLIGMVTGIYLITQSIHGTVRFFTSYLIVTKASIWELHFKGFRQIHGNRSGFFDIFAYLFAGLIFISGLIPMGFLTLNRLEFWNETYFRFCATSAIVGIVMSSWVLYHELKHNEDIENSLIQKWQESFDKE